MADHLDGALSKAGRAFPLHGRRTKYIESDAAHPPRKYRGRDWWLRQTWTFAAGKFLTDPIWWFYLFWIPDYMQRQHGLVLSKIGPPIFVIYVISDIGSVAGGWISSFLLRRGLSVNASRKWAMLVCAICVLPIAAASRLSGLWPRLC